MVSQTPYSIGYVQFIYALRRHLNFGAVQNAAAKFVRADIDSLTAAANTLAAGTQSLVNCPGGGAYPIASATWLVIPTAMPDAKRGRMAEFLNWTLTSGQNEAAALGYIALPHQVAQNARAALRELWEK
jgi:phosphate transport system substrate-binding protein